jgi:hypothetical protein
MTDRFRQEALKPRRERVHEIGGLTAYRHAFEDALKPNFASIPARSSILAKPALVNGPPNSDVNTNGILPAKSDGVILRSDDKR